MKKTILYVVLFLIAFTARAQYMQDVNGKPLMAGKYVDVVGTPYLFENWTKGEVTLSDGKNYKDLDLKYDQIEGIVFFKGKNGADLGFTSPVKSFILYPNNIAMSFIEVPWIKEVDKDPYFELLNDGKKVKFLKKTMKVIREGKAYGSATTTKTFSENTAYYLLKADGNYAKIKKDKKALLGVLNDKSAELEQYIKDKKTNFKEDASVAALVEYYNTL
ncbi:hypothetical protein [Emticicia sp. BO119]|uniref:hypothetical protein n=1 Tax=Emticicia sp. BO119 TaxID=2757768 RepID=UPI0015F041C6|nr:hypothetical protein [Emticicia sp. BO119]MBA4851890.1 hypothetical protein [Emticicia sp. BO119]